MRLIGLVGIGLLSLFVGSPLLAAENVSATLTAMEAKWSAASVTKDAVATSAILASDWHGQNRSGKRQDKAGALADLKDPKGKVVRITNHDVHVTLLSPTVAVVQGADDETSSYDGKDTSGTYTWTDVFQKRGATWVAVASQSTKVEARK